MMDTVSRQLSEDTFSLVSKTFFAISGVWVNLLAQWMLWTLPLLLLLVCIAARYTERRPAIVRPIEPRDR